MLIDAKAVVDLARGLKLLSDGLAAVSKALIQVSECKLPLETLNFSRRVVNCLDVAKVCTIGALVTYSRRDLLKLKGFGPNCLEEVAWKLSEAGYTLSGADREAA